MDQPRNRSGRRRRVWVPALVLSVGCAVAVLLSSTPTDLARASATPAPADSAYPALENSEPTGLPIVDPASSAAAAAAGPTFPADPSGGLATHGPVAETIRRLAVNLPGVSAWIAQSAEGGVCVLASRHEPTAGGPYGLGMSCVPAALLSSGTYLELQRAGADSGVVVGVAPEGVSAVRVSLTGGAGETVPVTGDAWALEAGAQVESTQNVIGG